MRTSTKASRSRIGDNPLDAVLSSKPTKRLSAVKEDPSKKAAKVRATFHLPEDLFEAVRDAVVHLSGPPNRLTIASFAENALRREIERLQKTENKGKVFPKRESELRGGRPIGS